VRDLSSQSFATLKCECSFKRLKIERNSFEEYSVLAMVSKEEQRPKKACYNFFFNSIASFAFVTRRPYCLGRPKKLCFTTQRLAAKTVGARLSVVKQSFFGLPGQYGRRVTKANCLTRRSSHGRPQQHKPTFG